MQIECLEVIRELSQYVDNDVTPELKQQILEHLTRCSHCTAIFDGLRNVVRLIGDRRTFALPVGFSERLRERLSQNVSFPR